MAIAAPPPTSIFFDDSEDTKQVPSFVISYLFVLNHKPILQNLSKEDYERGLNEPGIIGCLEKVKKYFLFKSKKISQLIETREFFNSYTVFDNDFLATKHIEEIQRIYSEKCSFFIFEYIKNFEKTNQKKSFLLKKFEEKVEMMLKT